jgi:hypothetical protein
LALKRAVKLADGWHPTGIHPDTFREMVALVPTEIQRSFTLSVRLTVELDGKGVREYTSPQGERRVILGGRESELSDYLSQYVRYGASHLVLYFGDTSPDKYVERMASFVRDVYPSVAT